MKVETWSEPLKKQQEDYDRLSKLSGKALDQAFLAAVIKDHKKDIDEFRNEAQSGSGPVSDLAMKTIPVLQHLDIAQSAQSKAAQQQNEQ